MSATYVAVQWNRQKRWYDAILVGLVLTFLVVFVGVSKAVHPRMTDEIVLIRAFGAAAFALLHGILCIGPLCRLDRRFLPLLYNRRHAGVTCFLLGLVHAVLVVVTYHGGGDVHPLVGVLTSTPVRLSPDSVPFQALGFVAFFILLVMAATSHDFWLAHLTAPVWKALHMSVYAAYAILVLHVTFGVLQTESSSVFAVATGGGFAVVAGLHLLAGFRERHRYRGLDEQNGRSEAGPRVSDADWVDACGVDEIPEGRARIVSLASERVAIFRYGGLVSAVSNVCQHQNGPLGEGRILHGCITCPWHGYQYQPADGASPAPFSEKVPTFRVRVWDGRVFVDPHPFPAGTRVEPARIGQGSDGGPSAAERTAARGAITGSSRSDPPSPS